MTAASDIVKIAIPRPAYIGLPCSAEPGVPPATSTSIMLASIAQSAGMRQSSKRRLCEPLPFRPIRSPQSSSISHSLRGATNASSFGGPSGCGARTCPR